MSVRKPAAAARRRLRWLVRDRFPRRRVVRDVQGVRMVLPWAHRLPDYAYPGSPYGQNLVELAALLADSGPLTVLDVGANVGDSALQILNAADGRVLCVEGDVAYLEFLHVNVDEDPRITVVEALLAPDGAGAATTAVRSGGTTRFTVGAAADASRTVTPADLLAGHPEFVDLRLVKSDTDGYDVSLVPAIAETWADARPVLFFEYDPYLCRLAGQDPLAVWPALERLGYRAVAAWDHGGAPVGRTTVGDIAAQAGVLDDFPRRRPGSRTYWDVAVVHEADEAGQRAIERMIPQAL